MTPLPVMPSSVTDPTGLARLEAGAFRDFNRRIRIIRNAYIDSIERFSPQLVVNAKYSFSLDQVLVREIMSGLGTLVDSLILEGGENQLWFFNQYVQVAYQRGTNQEFANLSRQSEVYRAGRESLQNLINSEPYRARIALIRAREFEEMQGLGGGIKANMTRVLTDGMARGLNPREIAVNLTERAGIEERRAKLIARTEIPTALRRARMDEADDARERYILDTKMMWLSALLPTTRPNHRARHAKLFTTDENRDFWSTAKEVCNCRCTCVAVMVDENGEPLNQRALARARESLKLTEPAEE